MAIQKKIFHFAVFLGCCDMMSTLAKFINEEKQFSFVQSFYMYCVEMANGRSCYLKIILNYTDRSKHTIQ